MSDLDYYEEMCKWRSKALMRENKIEYLEEELKEKEKEIKGLKWDIDSARRQTRMLDNDWRNLYYTLNGKAYRK